MSQSRYSEALKIAKEVGHLASELLRGVDPKRAKVRSKGNLRDLVTEWDTRCEELIVTELERRMPGVAILAEESGLRGEVAADRWLVDPIDGTVNFAHGLPMFGICLSFEEAGTPVAAVIEAPAMAWTFEAQEGQGAYCNGERLQVSQVTHLEAALVASGFPYDRATTQHNFAQWEHFLRKAGGVRRMGAASLDLALVARGWIDGYWESRLSPWDLSAGALLVREAGGEVTAITGGVFSSQEGHALASNGGIHKEMLAELAAVGFPAL